MGGVRTIANYRDDLGTELSPKQLSVRRSEASEMTTSLAIQTCSPCGSPPPPPDRAHSAYSAGIAT